MTSPHADTPGVDASIHLLESAAAAGLDFPEGLRLSALAVSAARRDGASDDVLGQSLLLQAHYAYRLFDYALAYESALDAGTALARCGDSARRGRALNYCFITCIETGDLVRALEHSTRALALAEAADDAVQRATLLHNQAVVFEMVGDQDNALACLARSARLHDTLPDGGPGAFFARVNAAGIHLVRAEGAEDEAAASAHRSAAVRELPPLRSDAAPAALQTWLSIQSRLGNLAAAREAAIICVAKARRNRSSERYRTYAMLALADYHLGRDRPDRGAACLENAVRKLRAARNQSHLGATERRLAALHAGLGRHDRALHWLRQAEADNTRLQAERHEVRWSFAESDRDEKRRHSLRDEVLVHVQRLDVIGRLIAEIHHALAQPLAAVRATLRQLLSATDRPHDPGRLRIALDDVIEQVDAASALVRQLKMFSYRASPQPSEVNLGLALEQAWADASLWRHGRTRQLAIESRQRPVVHVDAQRLAVLLHILLIEADRVTAPDDLAATIDSDGTTCGMSLGCGTGDVGRVSGRVGITLCAEIAHEVGGHLTCVPAPEGRVVLHLRLPLMNSL
ncbi:hypothetical protein [Piscinibacter gummiphilus]|uniref:Uncharacterized protein n=1 Tax=Piscinibacter gummiphilus TaxID=946333 RepID=A0A1W6L910_9BURK|nr:hypothetical protein [Piscinibacter gummiphilus]ARN20785.1 hypothetical protein A4W93_13250 [Piscinibacter gummiphilus]ATU65460.1 hypothetical protein CPZ87_13330 [Piscinibacter gummiphilus]